MSDEGEDEPSALEIWGINRCTEMPEKIEDMYRKKNNDTGEGVRE